MKNPFRKKKKVAITKYELRIMYSDRKPTFISTDVHKGDLEKEILGIMKSLRQKQDFYCSLNYNFIISLENLYAVGVQKI